MACWTCSVISHLVRDEGEGEGGWIHLAHAATHPPLPHRWHLLRGPMAGSHPLAPPPNLPLSGHPPQLPHPPPLLLAAQPAGGGVAGGIRVDRSGCVQSHGKEVCSGRQYPSLVRGPRSETRSGRAIRDDDEACGEVASYEWPLPWLGETHVESLTSDRWLGFISSDQVRSLSLSPLLGMLLTLTPLACLQVETCLEAARYCDEYLLRKVFDCVPIMRCTSCVQEEG